MEAVKRRYIVHIDPRYWQFRFEKFNYMSESKQNALKQQEYELIDQELSSGKDCLTIFSPMIDGVRMLQIQQISEEEARNIQYTEIKPAATGSGN